MSRGHYHKSWSHPWSWGKQLGNLCLQLTSLRKSHEGLHEPWSLLQVLRQWPVLHEFDPLRPSEEHDHSHDPWQPSRAIKWLVGKGLILGILASTLPIPPQTRPQPWWWWCSPRQCLRESGIPQSSLLDLSHFHESNFNVLFQFQPTIFGMLHFHLLVSFLVFPLQTMLYGICPFSFRLLLQMDKLR